MKESPRPRWAGWESSPYGPVTLGRRIIASATIIARRSATINRLGALINRYVFCVFVLAYCLCLGPAEWLRIHGHVNSATIIILFDPLVWLIDNGLMSEWLATWTLW